MKTLILYNEPLSDPADPDRASEAGVLESVEAIADALRSRRNCVEVLGLAHSIQPLLEAALSPEKPDLVFNLCEGFRGNPALEPHIACLLELLNLPYTGSGPESLALARDKARTKWLLAGAGLPTAPFLRLDCNDAPPRAELDDFLSRGPVIVKPASEDASLGIGENSVCLSREEVLERVEEIHRRYGPVLIEQFIEGREFNVGAHGDPPVLFPLAEIEFDNDPDNPWRIVTYSAKWRPDSLACVMTPPRCPADVEPELAQRISAVALRALRLVGCRDYARVDLRVAKDGTPFILEVNANPDLAPSAGLAKAAVAAGLEFADFIESIARRALARSIR